jgi:16S rRNA (uracil1498-N3)-methyltransferase
LQRYFVTNQPATESFVIEGEDYHHISRVMRMKIGDQIICVNDDQRSAICSIAEITDEQIRVDVVKWEDENVELPIQVTIVSGLPKGDKLEWIIQKGTELGANEFVPFLAARSIVKWDEKKGAKKLERWQKIAKEAAEQSHRNTIPDISSPLSLKALLQKAEQFDYCLVAYEEEARLGEMAILTKTLKDINPGQSLLIVFGPEGGLTNEEVAKFKENRFLVCGLGPRILRTETAPLYLLSAVSYHFELLR